MESIERDYYLVLYDIMGIQNFIFSTNKLQENLGSSSIVENILSRKKLKKILSNIFRDILYLDDNSIQASSLEVNSLVNDGVLIYAAGGTALILSNSKIKIKKATKELSKRVLIETGNILSVAMASKPTDFTNYIEDYEEMEKLIEKNKREKIQTMPLLGIAITKEEFSTGLPAQYCIKYQDELEYISYPTILKRKSSQEDVYQTTYLDNYKDSINNRYKYKFPKDIGELCQIPGQNDIALIHIDGNDMGRKRKLLLEDISEYSKALINMNELSNKITKLFKSTTKKTIENLIDKLDELNKGDIIKCKGKNLPLRPLILNGDDITFISHGKLGIGFAEAFIRNLQKIQMDEMNFYKLNNQPLNFSASAGVLIINTKFPFHRAYEICEELCRSAKTWGKAIEIKNKKQNSEEDKFIFTEGSWIDFHICHSTININLSETRRGRYNILGIDQPIPFEIEFNRKSYKIPQYNLLWRPWCVTINNKLQDVRENHDWSDLIQIILDFETQEWPRNKLMNFKKSLFSSKEKVEQFKLELPRNNLEIPEFLSKRKIWRDLKTPYFDALDLMDYYYKII